MLIKAYLNSAFSPKTFSAIAAAGISCLGVLCGVTGLAAALDPDLMKTQGWPYLGAVAGLSLVWGLMVGRPRLRFVRTMSAPRTEVAYRVGDLFAGSDDLIIGVTDTFDVEVPDVISADSVQGQFTRIAYEGNSKKLGDDLDKALHGVLPISTELRSNKPLGRLSRYPIGTIATLRDGRRYYCTAYSTMSNSNVAQSSLDDLWHSLSCLWVEIRRVGELRPISVAVLGSGLARLGASASNMDLARLILLSYVMASREALVAKRLTLVISQDAAINMDLKALRDFLEAQ